MKKVILILALFLGASMTSFSQTNNTLLVDSDSGEELTIEGEVQEGDELIMFPGNAVYKANGNFIGIAVPASPVLNMENNIIIHNARAVTYHKVIRH